MDNEASGKAKGGFARAEKLTPEQRSEIARHAVQQRWAKSGIQGDALSTEYFNELNIGNAEFKAAVLEDGTRVLTRATFVKAIGRTGKAKGGRAYDDEFKLPVFLTANNLKPYISDELKENSSPILFKHKNTQFIGYRAELLPQVCGVFIDADEAGVLTKMQKHIAQKCRILLRGFATVGLIALIDEATGYQDVRDRQALQVILDKFLRKEYAAWARRFPLEFYKEIFRLRGWEWKGLKVNPPQIVAKYTNDIVYSRLTPGLLEELEKKNPKNEKGNRKTKHHQWLTEDVGHPALAQHLYAVIGLMRIAEDHGWDTFKVMLDRAYPRYTKLKDLPLFSDLSLPSETQPLS
jgi:hypothetical protein